MKLEIAYVKTTQIHQKKQQQELMPNKKGPLKRILELFSGKVSVAQVYQKGAMR